MYEAIVISNGWDDLTAALQLLAHLDGEALNVALLVPEDQRRRPGMLIESLTAHYTSPGRLSQRRRQFEQMTRPVGEDPAVFAIALETLARRAFVEVDPTVRLQLVRDKFITGQPQLALRRHLDSAGRTHRWWILWINVACGKAMRNYVDARRWNVNQEPPEGFFMFASRS